jgi:hypothetical protein
MKKLLVFIIVLLLTTLLLTPFTTANSDKDKPLQATDVELVKKITVRGKPQGGKPSKGSATGILGTGYSGDKYAIVIGISDYPGTSSDLEYADDDARSMKDALVQVYGFPDSKYNIKLLIDSNAIYDNIVSAINDIKAQADSSSEVVFFFSGHGAKGTVDDGDTEKIDESIVCWKEGDFYYLWDGELKTLFEGFATSRIIFIFDSCLSGGMTDLASTGRVIAMATSESGTGYEFDSLEHGQFTYYFVNEGMINGKADKYDHNRDGKQNDVTVEEAFDYAKANCVIQKPTISDSFENDLLP